MEKHIVRLTANQIALLRRLVSEKYQFMKNYPLPDDRPEELLEVDKVLNWVYSTQC